MMEWSFEGQMEVAQAIANQWGAWMRANGVQEVVVEVEGVGTRAAVSSQVQHQGQWVNNALPVELVRLGVDLRVAMGRPGGGAWTWARLSMSSTSSSPTSTTTVNPFWTHPTQLRMWPKNWRLSRGNRMLFLTGCVSAARLPSVPVVGFLAEAPY